MPTPAFGGANDFLDTGATGANGNYGGPCPPVGDKPHHYVFTLHALAVDNVETASGIRKTGSPNLHSFILNKGLGDKLLGKATFTANRVEMTYEGWDETCRWIFALFAKEGPFDGVFGFSQGGALAALLVGLRALDGKRTEHQPLAFGFAILVGAFAVRDLHLATLYESTSSYNLPSIHIIGRADSVVPSQASRSLASQFNRPLILEHDGGHVIAANPEIRARVAKFLEDRRAGGL